MADQPLAAEPNAGLAHRQQLGMGGRVAIGQRAVRSRGDDPPLGSTTTAPTGTSPSAAAGGEIEGVAHGGGQDHGPLYHP